MHGLISDRFLKLFLKGFHRPSKPSSAPGRESLAEGTAERINPSDYLEKTEPLEKAVELTQKFHHPGGVNGTPTATQQSDDPQKQTQTKQGDLS